MKILSGGWKTLVDLARALILQPTILFLDEPTKNLDLDAVIWLQYYLSEYQGTFICVTHSIDLVDSVATCIWYLGNLDHTGQNLYTSVGQTNALFKMIEEKSNEAKNKYEK